MAVFKNSGYNDWKNAKGVKCGALSLHEGQEAHRNAAVKTLAIKDVCEGRSRDVQSYASKQYDDSVKSNQGILFSINDVIISLGKQNILFRGHDWNKKTSRENGNFDFFIH